MEKVNPNPKKEKKKKVQNRMEKKIVMNNPEEHVN